MRAVLFCEVLETVQNVTLPAPMTLHDGKVLGVKGDSMQTDTMLVLVSKVFQMKSCNGKSLAFGWFGPDGNCL
jgi:hypothetical protein